MVRAKFLCKVKRFSHFEASDEQGNGTKFFVVDFEPVNACSNPVPNADPDGAPTVTVRNAKQLRHRAWKQPDLEASLGSAGFTDIEWFGGMKREPFVLLDSHDLVLHARRE